MTQMSGNSSIKFDKPVYLTDSASIVGKKEGEGPLAQYFDVIGDDPMFGCNNWEEAESTLLIEAVRLRSEKQASRPMISAIFLQVIFSVS